MKVKLPYADEIEIAEEEMITFTQGPPAFEEYTKFFIIDPEEEDYPFKLLQSAEEESLSFILTDPFIFKPDYDFMIDEETLQELEIEGPSDVAVFVILVIPDKVEDISANLAAPVIINAKKRLARQVILDEPEYQTRHKVFTHADS